jgi:carbon monoxide dehydrogenase subunit G
MVIQEKFVVRAPIKEVWKFSMDPEQVGRCVPGCEKIERLDERTYLTVVRAGVGPIRVRFKFTSTLTEIDEPRHIHFESKGEDMGKAGSFSQTSDIDFREISEREVEVSYSSSINVVGRLATFGERVMRAQAKKMGEQFIQSFKEKIEAKKETLP